MERNPRRVASLASSVLLGGCVCALLAYSSFAAAAEPKRSGHIFRQGVEAYQTHRLEEAVRLFHQAVTENPADSEAFYYLGLTQQRMKSHEKAAASFREALRLSEGFEEAHLPLGISLYSLKRYEEAAIEINRGLLSDPTNSSAHLFLGLVYMELKKFPIAEPHLRAATLTPDVAPIARLNLGTLAFQLHQEEKARREFEEVLRLAPEGELADAARTSLDALARQEKSKRPWKLSVEAGVEHSDNVTRIEADQVTNESDFSAVLSAAGSYRLLDTPAWKGSVGYNFYQQLYDKVATQDFQSHTGEMSLYKSFNKWEVGGEYSFSYNFLDEDDFLQIQAVTSRLHLFPRPWFFSQLSYSFQEKVFFQDKRRGGWAHLAGVNQFFFFDNSRGFVLVGFQYESENARSGELDFRGFTANASLRLPLAMILPGPSTRRASAFLPPDLSLEGGVTYRGKDFIKETESIGRRRNDDSRVYRIALKGSLLPGLTAAIQYKYTNSGSNLGSVNYTENTFMVLFTYHF